MSFPNSIWNGAKCEFLAPAWAHICYKKPMDFAQMRISAWMSMLQRGHVFDACIQSICKPQIVKHQLFLFVAFSEIGLGLRWQFDR